MALVSEAVALRRVGRQWVGLCPFHEERTPSFHVTPERGLYYCYGCHAGGDAFSFVMQREGCDFPEAVERLAALAGVRLPERQRQNPAARAERDGLAAALEAAAAFFRERLPAAADYLQRRGVDEATAERFGLGYAPGEWDALLRALSRRGHAPQALARAGLIVPRPSGDGHYDRFRHRLMFPIHDERGAVIAFGGRSLGDEPPKYLNSPETPLFSKRRTWYGLHLARETMRRTGRAVVVEGYMDVVSAHRHGFTGSVASLGTSLSEEQAGVITHYAEEVLIAYDADAAGTAATWRGLGILQRTAARVRVVALVAGKDPDEILRERPEAFRDALEGALPLVDYVVGRVMDEHNVEAGVAERLAAAEAVAPFVARCREPERSYYADRVARRLLLEPHAFAPIWGRMAEKGEAHKPGDRRENTHGWTQIATLGPVAAARKAQEGLLALMAVSEEHARWVRDRATPADFGEGTPRALFEALGLVMDVADEQAAASPPGERVLDRDVDPDVRAMVGRLLVAAPPSGPPDRAREDWLAYLVRLRRQARLDGLRARMSRGEELSRDELEELRQLLGELNQLKKLEGAQRRRSNADA